MGDEPARVHRIAGEAAADLVVHPATRHRAEGGGRHAHFAAAQQELDRGRRRELRRAAEAAVVRVEGLAQEVDRRVEALGVDLAVARAEERAALKPPRDALAAGADLVLSGAPGIGDRLQDAAPARHPDGTLP